MHKCRAPARRRASAHDPTGIKIEPRMGLIPFGPRSGRLFRIDHGKHGQITKGAAAIPCAFRVFRGSRRLSLRFAESADGAPFVGFVEESLVRPPYAPAALMAASISSSVW